MLSRVRTPLDALSVRNVTHLRILRLRNAASVANVRLVCERAINAHANVGLSSALLKAAIEVNRIIAALSEAARRLRMACLASV